MGFHVGFKLALLASWPALIPVVLGLMSLLCGWWIRRSAGISGRKTVGMVMLITGLVMMSISLWIPFSVSGTGWSIAKNTLTVKTGFQTVTWPIKSLRATWVSMSGLYRPVARTGAYSGGAFQTGEFALANGMKAIVFHYGKNPSLLITHGNSIPLLISSPNVTGLDQVLTQHLVSRVLPSSGVSQTGRGWAVFVSVVLLFLFTYCQWSLKTTWDAKVPSRMVVRWNFAGQPDGWVSKKLGMRIGLLLSIGFSLFAVILMAGGRSLLALFPFIVLQVLLFSFFRWVYQLNSKRNRTG